MATQRSKMAAEVNNQFGLQIYSSITKHAESKDNVFFSPLSIMSALAMTYMGARGEMARQMESVMKLSSPGNDVHHAMRNVNSDHIRAPPSLNQQEDHQQASNVKFSSCGEDIHHAFQDLNLDLFPTSRQHVGSYQLKLANRLYGQKSFSFASEFIAASHDFYNAKLEAVDFVTQTEETRMAINSWVEEQTAGKICDLLAPGVLSPDSRLVLVNALYFKRAWTEQFKEYNTRVLPFHLSSFNIANVPMMFQQEQFGYFHDMSHKCQILLMNYEGYKVSMMVALPDEIDGLATLEASLTGDVLKSWMSNLSTAECRVTFPKFKFTKSFSSVDQLKQMGISDLFQDGKADLSGISKDDKLFVSEVVHKAFLEVNEKRTEAAAATAMVMMAQCAAMRMPVPPKEFKADHPFVFFICDNSSGAVIFMGRVMHPVIE